jgi:tyrosyl-tRNA synthetase
MDSVKLRLERDQEMSFIEFNYMILQAYDYAVLNQRYDCRLQMGGSDQWGNIVNGIDLGRRMGTPQLHALTTPLITTSSGEKMGKTASGAVWLNADMTSPYEYWQFWRNTDDADVKRFLKLFTTLPLDEVERLAALQGAEINEAKKALADAATLLLHGADAARAAAETARQTFEEGAIDENLPTMLIPKHEQQHFYGPDGLSVIIAVQLTRLVRSNGEARRLIESRGLKINDVTVTDIMRGLTPADLREGVIKVSLGKKRHILLKPA